MVGVGGNDYGKTIRMRQIPLIALGHQTIKITWFLMIFHEKCFDPTCFFPWVLLGCPMGWGGESWRQLHGNPWYPVESDGIHEVMRLKPDQIQWNLLGFMRLWHPNLIKSNGIWLDSWDFKTQTLSIPVESDGFHQVLPIKSFQIQWNVMGSIRF